PRPGRKRVLTTYMHPRSVFWLSPWLGPRVCVTRLRSWSHFWQGGPPARPWRPRRSALQGAAMRTHSFRRTAAILLLLLAAILAAPPASAASRPAEAVSLSPLEALDRLWSFLRAAWSKEGCNIDPNGQCKPGTTNPPAATKEGCHIDPDGRYKPGTASPPAETKEGCNIDPDGLCK